MKLHKLLLFGVICSAGLLLSSTALAGIYADDLAKCFVSSTSTSDRNSLVKWMFTSAALHPAVKSIVSVSAAQQKVSDQFMAKLTERLMFESCKTQLQQAMQYEGPLALQAGFQGLGQVAGRELFSDPSVARAMGNLKNYIDKQKMEKLLGPPEREN